MATQKKDHGQGDVKDPAHDGRLKQNRGGADAGESGGARRHQASGGGDHDRRHDDNGQGRVKDPEHDGRLKENRERGVSLHTTDGRDDVEHGGQGRVKDPEHDGRLKQNR